MKKQVLICLMLGLALMLSACQSSQDAMTTTNPSEQPSVTTPGPTPSPTLASTVMPTSTPASPSDAPLAVSPTPAATQAPGFVPPFHFEYPDAVRGIYVTGWSAGGERMSKLLSLVDNTDLNAMVIDMKDDDGYITFKPDGKLAEFGQPYIKDPKALLKTLEEHKIYPIARIVVFKDTVMAKKRSDLSFIDGSSIWRNSNGDSFINPFLKETWDHNVEVAKLAAELGFKEIQFDYVRFPEGFESRDNVLKYTMGDYKDKKPTKFVQEEKDYAEASKKYQEDLASLELKLADASNAYNVEKSEANKKVMDDAQKNVSDLKKGAPRVPDFSDKARMTQLRVDAVSDFVAYAKDQLKPYGVDVSVDIFGYSATLPEAPGIGQNFNRIASSVDVISSMIYPSHWSNGYFGISRPDKEPYNLVAEYMKAEKAKFAQLQSPPQSRPWIQDFTASWLGAGNYIKYGKAEVDAQIKALHDAGVQEYLIWNANNNYSEGVTYIP
ncbi:putative glycoside hydrolase [Paenibacillus chondroitinus]|uniref:Glycoside hydrolase n=1 Tax=Paenibacillus chondroitinus TaxID=59842 RepID=A0ABU6D965_9BACL|nr:putative glycoside hydrolase [Paenibacillus chondroitinus]MCY9661884.1 putative glycoside hydrolase [Paenibacillus anseongense]MEB4793970.1 putative glycoside hydrolase [Paenibacillus chondroitinus]